MHDMYTLESVRGFQGLNLGEIRDQVPAGPVHITCDFSIM